MTEELPRGDILVVQEKLDGSNVGVCKVGGRVLAIGRAGWLAASSPYVQHQLFAGWVREREAVFDNLLSEGERVCGEWLALAHGTRYELRHDPFVAFDIFTADERQLNFNEFYGRVCYTGLATPHVLHFAGTAYPLKLDSVTSMHGAEGGVPEGFVYRWERKGRVLMLAKWVRPGKEDGCLLPEVSGKEPIWNWRFE